MVHSTGLTLLWISPSADNPPTCSPNKFFDRQEPWCLRTDLPTPAEAGFAKAEALQRPGAEEGILSRYYGLCPWGSIRVVYYFLI